VNRDDARRIVRTLRQGTVSPESASAISVGTEEIRDTISDSLKRFEEAGSDGCALLVEGDWGSGKSHVSMLCRAVLARRNLAWIFDAVDGRGSSLSHVNRCVPNWLENIRIGSSLGLRGALENGIVDRLKLTSWAVKHPNDLGSGLLAALSGYEGGWLRATGHLCAMPDDSRQRTRAVALVISTAEIVKHLGFGGVVLVLDEVENIIREWDVRGRRRAYDTLAAFAECKAIKLVLLVTPRFMSQLDIDISRSSVEREWSDRARAFMKAAASGPRLVVPTLSKQKAGELLKRIHEIYCAAVARGVASSLDEYGGRVHRVWTTTATQSTRLLVRLAVHHLDLLSQQLVEDSAAFVSHR
jgi:hypothetical protein